MSASQVVASGALIGIFLLIIGGTGAVTFIGKYTPKAVIRGVQLSTGTLTTGEPGRQVYGGHLKIPGAPRSSRTLSERSEPRASPYWDLDRDCGWCFDTSLVGQQEISGWSFCRFGGIRSRPDSWNPRRV